MADISENILLSIEFNNGDIEKAIGNIVESRKQIDALIEANKKLVAQGEKNSAEYVKNQEAIKGLNKEVSSNSKIVQANTQAVEQNALTIEVLKKKNSELLKERNKVDISTEEGRKKIQELNAEYDKNSKTIAKNSTEVEKQRFNIGNYSSALDGVVPGLSSVTSGIESSTKASKAFIATPLGAVLAVIGLAVAAVTAYFQKFEPVLDFIEDAVTKVTAVFDSLIQNLDLVASIVGNVLTGNFAAAAVATNQLGTAMGDAATEAQRLLDMTRELEDAELKYKIASAGATNQMKAWVVESKRKGISIEESNELLQKASDLENELTAEAVANAQKRADIEQGKLIASRKAQLDAAGIAQKAGETQAEFLNRLIDSGIFSPEALAPVIAAYEKVQQEASAGLAFQEKIANQRIAQEEKTQAEREKIAEKNRALREKQESEEAAAIKNISDLQNQLLEDGVEKQKAILQTAADNKILLLKGTEEQIAEQTRLIQENLIKSLAEVDTKAQEERLKKEDAKRKQDEALQAETLARELENYKNHVQELINVEKEKLLQGLISQEEYNDEINDLNLAALQVELELKEKFGQEDLALEGRITDAKIALKKFEADETVRLERLKLQAIQSTLGSVASLFNENSIAFKALASAQTLIQTYQSAQSVYAGMVEAVPGPLGVALGIAGSVASVIRGLANVARINQVQLPRLEDGGLIEIGGKRHSQGGEDVSIGGRKVANVEAGENMVILKRGSSKLLRNLSNINQMAGGVDFFNNRAPKSFLADGGFVARSAASQVSSFQNLSIAEDLKKAKFEVSVTEIDKVRKDVIRANVTSELR